MEPQVRSPPRKRRHHGHDDRRTYVLSGEAGLDHQHLRDILDTHGWREVPVTVRRCTFVWAELTEHMRFDRRSYSIICDLKNVLDDDEKRIVSDKGRLHAEMLRVHPEVAAKHMASTRLLSSVERVEAGQVLILRPVGQWAWSGNGISRVGSTAELQRVRREMLARCPEAIASDYLADPLLWQGRKMHLRMYWLVRAEPFGEQLWERGKVLTASERYSAADLASDAVHDTHAKSTPRNLFFPEDVELGDAERASVLAQMRAVMAAVGDVLRGHAVPYKESRSAYEVFGCDFLVERQTLRPVLMEVNERVGFQPVPGDDDDDGRYAQFTKRYYRWVYDNAIAPLFPYKGPDGDGDGAPEAAPPAARGKGEGHTREAQHPHDAGAQAGETSDGAAPESKLT
eukprot:m51a1_g14570 hypothetical protein (399) ;mRNA; r:1068283-1069650